MNKETNKTRTEYLIIVNGITKSVHDLTEIQLQEVEWLVALEQIHREEMGNV